MTDVPASFEALAEAARRWVKGDTPSGLHRPGRARYAPPDEDLAHALGPSLDRLIGPEDVTAIHPELDETIPCLLNDSPTLTRTFWCGNPDPHDADVEGLWSCGCSTPYCRTAFDRIAAEVTDGITCDVTGNGNISIVAVRELRGHRLP